MKKYIIGLLLLSSPPLLWWFLPGHIVDGTDIIFPLNPSLNLNRGLIAWDPIYNTGSLFFAFQVYLTKFPIYLFLSLLQFLNISLEWINKFWYFIYLFIPSLSFFLFSQELFGKNKHKNLLSFIGAVFYVYNLYFLQQIFDQAITLSYIFAPLILYLIIRGLRTKKILLHAILIGLVTFFYTPINPNSYLVGIIIISLFLLALVLKELLAKRYLEVFSIIKIIFLGALFSVFITAYIFIPYFFFLDQSVSGIRKEAADWLTGVSKYTSFFNVARLVGAWDWYEKWNKEYYAPYAQIYVQNYIFIALSLVPPFIATLGFILSKNKWRFFFGGLGALGIILAMGSHPPTGGIYIFLYNHFPFFWIFRSPWYKFSVFIVFSYAILIALFSECLFQRYSPRKITLILVVFFIILSFPLFLGTRFTKPSDRHGNLASLQVKIPDYVFETSRWFNKLPGDERIVMIPQIAWESTAYNWSYGNLLPPLYTLLEKNPILILPYDRQGPGIELLKAAKLALYTPNSTPSANYLAFLNAKYILNQKDFSYFYFRAPENAQDVEKLLNQQKEFSKIKTFGEWEIYRTDKFLPKIYMTDKIFILKNIYEAADLKVADNPAFVIDSGDEYPDASMNGKVVSYQKISPVHIKVRINTKSPYYLIFLETFDKNWTLTYNGETLPKKHFLVNSFANGFFIDKIGDYEVDIKHSSQKFFEVGFKVTKASLLILILLLGMLLTKEKMLKSANKEK